MKDLETIGAFTMLGGIFSIAALGAVTLAWILLVKGRDPKQGG